MADMYERIDDLLKKKGITGAKMSDELGMSRSFMTELRKGRAKSVKLETAQKIADYLQVSVKYLTTGIPDNVTECPDDENPWELELRDSFDKLDLDRQIIAATFVKNLSEDKKIPGEFVLTEEEKRLLEMFRLIPEEQQRHFLEMGRAFANSLRKG